MYLARFINSWAVTVDLQHDRSTNKNKISPYIIKPRAYGIDSLCMTDYMYISY